MEIAEYKNIFENEPTHFFYQAIHQLVLQLIKQYSKGQRQVILDAGCGTGYLSKQMQKLGSVFAIDKSKEAIKFAQKRGIAPTTASLDKLPFKDNFFDIITCIDVIYHLGVDEQKALSEIYRVLKKGGLLILRVPANKWLKLKFDKNVHTRERYNKDELKVKLKKYGFIIKKISYVNMTLLPLAIAKSFWEKLFPPKEVESSIGKTPKLINFSLLSILIGENLLLKFFNLPFGLGLLAICKK